MGNWRLTRCCHENTNLPFQLISQQFLVHKFNRFLLLFDHWICLFDHWICVVISSTCISSKSCRTVIVEPNCRVLLLSQNISICWLLLIIFDHSSCSKNLRKYYLFCYDMFYHRIYLKHTSIVFSQIFWIRQMFKHDQQKSTNTYIIGRR